MAGKNILISGAGIAGPALAYWLRRYGFNATVAERAPAPRIGGQAIDIRGTAREVVRRMGLLDEVRAAHTGTHGIAYVDDAGNRVATLGGELFGDSGGVVAELEILRGDLMRLLHEAASDVEFRYGERITAMAEEADGVRVSFARGPEQTFDLVVGADGMRSAVRSLAFGPDTEYVSDLGYYTSYFPARTALAMGGWEEMYNLPSGNGVGGRAVLLYPIGDTGEVRAMFMFAAPEHAVDRQDVVAQKEFLRRAYAGAGWQVPDLLAQLDDTDNLYFDRAGAVQVPQWYRGRTVLLGDSVFGGSVGMGTSMALVGAYVLAGELAATGGDHRVAFAGYQRAMADFVVASQKRPPGGLNAFLPPTRFAIRMRTMMTKMLPYLPGKKLLLGGLDKASNAITLRDYQQAQQVS